MAVKTTFTEQALSEILSGYDLGEFQNARPISAGTVQTNYCVQTTRGKFVFRYYENRSKKSAAFECKLMQYLRDRNYPCPTPFRNKKRDYVGLYGEKPFALFEFIEGQHLDQPTPAQTKQLIQKVAELQNLTQGYKPPYLRYRWNYSAALCRDLAQKTAQTLGTPNASAKLAWLMAELAALSLPRTLPKGICHCDFHFSNILFRDGEFAALIDFDDANYTFLTYDLISLINPFIASFEWDTWEQFAPGAEVFDFAQARSVLNEYTRHRPLSPIEKKHLFDVYKLSILFDCIWYFERGEVGDFYERRKLDALNRLGREGFYQQLFA